MLALDAPTSAGRWQTFVRHQARALHRVLVAHPHAITLFATRPAVTPAAVERLDRYLAVLLEAGFKPLDALSIVQLVSQLVVGHAMWTTGVEIALASSPTVGSAPPPPSVQRVARVLARWDAGRELAMGIDALLVGFERLLA